MPFKIEIHTLTGPYITTAPEDCKDPLKWIEDHLRNNAALTLDDGTLWKPWNKDHIVALVQVPDFPAVEEVKGAAHGIIEGTNPALTIWEGPAGIVCPWYDDVTYMGKQYRTVIFSTQDKEGRPYFLLYTIDGVAARDMISDEGQKKFVQAWLVQCHGGPIKDYTVILPPGTIYDKEEAEAYLKDYVRENQGDYKPKEKTGKAWQGFAEDRGQA